MRERKADNEGKDRERGKGEKERGGKGKRKRGGVGVSVVKTPRKWQRN